MEKEKLKYITDEELISLAREEVFKLAKTGGRSIKMCIPPMPTDTDIILCEIIDRYESCLNQQTLPKTNLHEAVQRIYEAGYYNGKVNREIDNFNIDKAVGEILAANDALNPKTLQKTLQKREYNCTPLCNSISCECEFRKL